jgi:hypothetical protein
MAVILKPKTVRGGHVIARVCVKNISVPVARELLENDPKYLGCVIQYTEKELTEVQRQLH